MSTYYKIVFGIKQRYLISDVLKILKHQRLCNILVSEHIALNIDDCCDRPDVHYHGVTEFIDGESKIVNFLNQLSPYCQYIKETRCSNPVDYLAYITLPPKRTIHQGIVFQSGKLLKYVQTACDIQLEVSKRKKDKMHALLEQNDDVINLVDFILKSGCNNYNIMPRLQKNESFWPLLKKKYYKPIMAAALDISKKIILNNSILTLSDRLELSDNYLSLEESVHFVKNWCSFQKLDPKEFTKNLIRCLDKKGGNRFSIYLQGSENSGKSFIVQSIIEACVYVGQVVHESSAYSFVWENCVDKRLIVIREPHFSMKNLDQLDRILGGSGTIIYKHNDMVDYLQPTPVIILAKEHEWTECPELNEKIKKRFVCSYMNLKTYPMTTEKKLHPRWLNLLNKTFLGKNRPISDQKSSSKNHSLKAKGDRDLIIKDISKNINKDFENMKSILHDGKRPVRDDEHTRGRKKLCSGM